MEEITGYIERITFQNLENGFTIARIKEPKKKELTCIVGKISSVQAGETIACVGRWKTHPVFGPQFEVQSYTLEKPRDLVAIEKYLSSGFLSGIGAVYAQKIVDYFKLTTLDILEHSPYRLLEIPGIGKKKIEKIKKNWQDQKSLREIVFFLQTYDISAIYTQKIISLFGDNCIEKIKENPYELAQKIDGIGFKSADAIAQKMGIGLSSNKRIDAGIEFCLLELAKEGNVCYPLKGFIPRAKKILGVAPDFIESRLQALVINERIILSEQEDEGLFIWFKPYYLSEIGIAKEINRLLSFSDLAIDFNASENLEWLQQHLELQLSPSQLSTIQEVFNRKMHIITGGPGTGKSTLIKALVCITEKYKTKIFLAAPTGRAAKRMTEITGLQASTIHTLLGYDFKKRGFKRNRKNPLQCDFLIIDEVSMMDTFLMYHLLKAIPNHSKILFIGDIDQLPSIGPGNVLRDFICSHRISVSKLVEIFRQGAFSNIIINAHKVNNGQSLDLKNYSHGDFFFLEEENLGKIQNIIVDLLTKRLPSKYQLDPLRDIQVLTPMKKGPIGTENLNFLLQTNLNTTKEEPLSKLGRNFLVGDKIMQIKNNYYKEVYNGDIGYVSKINILDEQIQIDFEEKNVVYSFSEIDELILSYAVSIHKYQGSECPCVVIPIHSTHFIMLNRNLLYTAITRGKQLVILVGSKKAVEIAIQNNREKLRYTGLKQMLSLQN